MQRAIDFSALRHALSANPTLPQATLQGMLGTLPAAQDLTAEQAISARTRQAIVRAIEPRDGHYTDTASLHAAGLTVAAASLALTVMLSPWTPLFVITLLPALTLVSKWRHRRRLGEIVRNVQALAATGDFNAEQYRELLIALDWDGNSRDEKRRLLALAD